MVVLSRQGSETFHLLLFSTSRTALTFSLMMLRARMQSPSCLVTVPDGPYLWNVHFVTLGKTMFMGSLLPSGSPKVIANTSEPYVMRVYPRNLSVKYICPMTLTRQRNSQK